MHRQLSLARRTVLVDQYRRGKSTYALAREFRIDRHTVVKHLQRAGIEIPPQVKMTPDILEQAKRLYVSGNSRAAVVRRWVWTPQLSTRRSRGLV